jgi:hypothetical protein
MKIANLTPAPQNTSVDLHKIRDKSVKSKTLTQSPFNAVPPLWHMISEKIFEKEIHKLIQSADKKINHYSWKPLEFVLDHCEVPDELSLLEEAIKNGYQPNEDALLNSKSAAIADLFLQNHAPITARVIIKIASKGWDAQLETALGKSLIKGEAIPSSAINWAACFGHLSTVHLLMRYNAPVDQGTLLMAANSGNSDVVSSILKYGGKLGETSWGFYADNRFSIQGLVCPQFCPCDFSFNRTLPPRKEYEDFYLFRYLYILQTEITYLQERQLPVLDSYFDYLMAITKEVPNDVLSVACGIKNDDRALRWAKALIERGVELNPAAANNALCAQNVNTLQYLFELNISKKSIDLFAAFELKNPQLLQILIESPEVEIKISHIKYLNELTDQEREIILSAIVNRLQKKANYQDPKELKKHIVEVIEIITNNKIDCNKDFCDRFYSILNSHNLFDLPLEQTVLYHLEPGKLWPLLFPNFQLPLDLKSLSPWGFNPELYEKLLIFTQNACEEENNQGAVIHAYKLSVLFSSESEALDYIEYKKAMLKYSTQPVHDACLFNLPKSDIWDISLWKAFFLKERFSPSKMELLAFAPKIESCLNENVISYRRALKKIQENGNFQGDYQRIKNAVTKLYRKEIYSACRRNISYGKQLSALENLLKDSSFKKNEASLKKKIRELIWTFAKENFVIDIDELYAKKLPDEKYRQKNLLCKEILELAGSPFSNPKSKKTNYVKLYNEFKIRSPIEAATALSVALNEHSVQNINDQQLDLIANQLAIEKIRSGLDNEKPLSQLAYVMAVNRNIGEANFSFLLSIMVKKTFQTVDEKYYSFALDCIKGGIESSYFHECIDILEHKPKQYDFIPDVKIEGSLIGEPAYYLEKMTSGDPDIFILGKKTRCCQSIDGHSRECVLHGATSPYGCFIRIMKRGSKDSWVAQGWTALAVNKEKNELELVIDSIEYNQGHKTEVIMNLFALAATDLLSREPRIARVLFGGGGNTPKNHTYAKLPEVKNYSHIIGYREIGYDSLVSRYVLADRDKPDPELQLLAQSIDHSRLAKTLPEMSDDGFVLTKGTDTYVHIGEEFSSLSLNLLDRSAFFRSHPEAAQMMQAHPLNPLLEEGFYETNNREKLGEYFLPFTAIKKLVERKIVAKVDEPGTSYKVDYLILEENNKETLLKKLQEIPTLDEGKNILIGYVDEVHATGAYIQRSNGRLQCLLADPENPCEEHSILYQIISKVFPEIKIARLTAKLQLDYYSCSTFLIQFLMHTAKQGKQVWEYIESIEDFSTQKETYDIPPEKTPAALLKMAQKVDYKLVSPASLQQIVSVKKQKTLSCYVSDHSKTFRHKTYNLAAIRKKYRWLKLIGAS